MRPDVAAVDARVAVISTTRRVGGYLTAVTGTDPDISGGSSTEVDRVQRPHLGPGRPRLRPGVK